MTKTKYSFTPFPELKSERLMLRQLRKVDSQDIFFLHTVEGVNQYNDRPKPGNIEDAKEFMIKSTDGICQQKIIV